MIAEACSFGGRGHTNDDARERGGRRGGRGDGREERGETYYTGGEATRMIMAMIAEIDGAYYLSPGGRHHTDDDGKI